MLGSVRIATYKLLLRNTAANTAPNISRASCGLDVLGLGVFPLDDHLLSLLNLPQIHRVYLPTLSIADPLSIPFAVLEWLPYSVLALLF